MTQEIISCSVPKCNSTSNSSVIFYKFPRDENVRKIWLTLIGRPELFDLPVQDLLSNHFVCSLHLESKDQVVDISKEDHSETCEDHNSNESLQSCSQPESSSIQAVLVDEPIIENILNHCNCGLYFMSPEDYTRHVQIDCALLQQSNKGELVNIEEFANDKDKTPPIEKQENETIPKCKVCRKTFVNETRLHHHMSQHTGHRPFKCERCGKTFFEMESLKIHMRAIHKEFRCDICNKLHKSHDELKTHRLIHDESKNYKCDKCSEVFVSSQALQIHLGKHGEEKSFKCTKCSKQFVHNARLQTHMKIHTGDKPFECEICHKSFLKFSNLKIHKKNHK